MNVVKLKAIKIIDNYCTYILDRERHKGQEIIELNSFDENVKKMNVDIDNYKQGKRGRRPKPLSIVLSYPKGTSVEDLIIQHKRMWTDFFQYVSDINNLELNKDDISKIISDIPSAIHYKTSNPHTHNLINRIFYNRAKSCLVSIDISKKQYHRKLMSLSGWSIQDKIQNKKSKSQYDYKLEQIQEEFEKFQNINEKLDRYISIALEDLKRGRTKKASTKLLKIKKQMG